MDLINLARGRDKWWAIANVVVNLHISKMHIIVSLADELLACERLRLFLF